MTTTVQPVLKTHIVHQRYKKDGEENKHDPEIVKLREREREENGKETEDDHQPWCGNEGPQNMLI